MYNDYSELTEVRKATGVLLRSIKKDLLQLKLGIALEQTKYEKYKTIDAIIDNINFNLGINDYKIDVSAIDVIQKLTGAL